MSARKKCADRGLVKDSAGVTRYTWSNSNYDESMLYFFYA